MSDLPNEDILRRLGEQKFQELTTPITGEPVEPPEVTQLKEWLVRDGQKGHWHGNIQAAEYWGLPVDDTHKKIADYLVQLAGADTLYHLQRHLLELHGIMPRQTISVRELERRLHSDLQDGRFRYGPSKEPRVLIWDYQPKLLSKRNWEFLRVVWGCHNVPFEELGERVWDDDTTPAKTIRSQIFKLNKELLDHDVPLVFESKTEHVNLLGDWPS